MIGSEEKKGKGLKKNEQKSQDCYKSHSSIV